MKITSNCNCRAIMAVSMILLGIGGTPHDVQAGAPGPQPSLPATTQIDLGIDQVGISEGEPIHTGFVFYDGRYVDPPYIVSRRGRALFINDKMIEPPGPRPAALSEEKKEEITLALDAVRSEYEDRLKDGHWYFCFGTGRPVEVNKYVAAFKVPTIFAGLRSPISTDLKVKALRGIASQYSASQASLEAMVRNFEAPARFEQRFRRQVDSLLRADEFGTTVGEPIDRGFVFWNSEYLEAPYRVSRKGLAVFINDRMIGMPAGILPPRQEPVAPPADPVLPKGISRDTSQYDPRLVKYLGAKIGFIRSKYPPEEARRVLAEVYASLPCVDRAEPHPDFPDSLLVAWADGDVDAVVVFPPRRPHIDMSPEAVVQRLEEQRRRYEDRLRKGAYYFWSDTGGGLITGGAAGAASILPRLIPILRSSASVEEKFIQAQKVGLPFDANTIEQMATGFSASPQLEQRLRALSALEAGEDGP